MHIHEQNESTAMRESHKRQSQRGNKSEPKSHYKLSCPPYFAKGGTNAHESENAFVPENLVNEENAFSGRSVELDAAKECTKTRSSLQSLGTKISRSPKPAVKVSEEQLCSEIERNGQIPDELSKFSTLLS